MEESGSQAASYLSVLFGATSFRTSWTASTSSPTWFLRQRRDGRACRHARGDFGAQDQLETEKQGLEDAPRELLARQDELESRQKEAAQTLNKLADDTEAAQAAFEEDPAAEDEVEAKIDKLTKQLEEELAKKRIRPS
jgi:hypothetical protein